MDLFENSRVTVQGDKNNLNIFIKPEKNGKKLLFIVFVCLLTIVLFCGLGYWMLYVIEGITMGILLAFLWLGVIVFPFAKGLFAQLFLAEKISIEYDEICINRGFNKYESRLTSLNSVKPSDTALRIGILEPFHNIYIYDRGRLLLKFAEKKKPIRFGKCLSGGETEAILKSIEGMLPTAN